MVPNLSAYIISHSSSLLFWEHIRLAFAASMPSKKIWIGSEVYRPLTSVWLPTISCKIVNPHFTEERVRSIIGLGSSKQIDVLVGSASDRAKSSGFINHVYSRKGLSDQLFYQVEPGCLVSSPEMTFIQMAEVMPLYDLIELGYMWCGTYTIDPFHNRVVGCPPLMTIESLKRCIDANGGMKGIRNARKALAHILERSNSPRETYSSIFLTLPKRLGGHAFLTPVLNDELEHEGIRVCPDMHWPEQKVVVEYNGSDHYGPGKGIRDDIRNNVYAAKRLKAYVLTNDHFTSVASFDHAANDIRRLLGIRSRPDTAEQLAARRDMALHYLGEDHWRCWDQLLRNGVWEP